jgi:hypothetical protein
VLLAVLKSTRKKSVRRSRLRVWTNDGGESRGVGAVGIMAPCRPLLAVSINDARRERVAQRRERRIAVAVKIRAFANFLVLIFH